jgi:DNA polymerase III delta prime subunit
MTEIWSQKHRPTILRDVIGRDDIVAQFKDMAGHIVMQNYLFHSQEAGTGKTTLARVLANEYGFQLHVFNASTKKERGIGFIEEELIPRTRTGNHKQIFLLDEADQLTDAAQSALKGVMENAHGYFILTCNNLAKVSPWLQSRCNLVRFPPYATKDIARILREITLKENVAGFVRMDDTIQRIAKHHSDARSAINFLQAYVSYGADKDKFLASLGTADVDYAKFLRVAVREKSFDGALKIIRGQPLADTLRGIFDYMVESDAKQESKLLIVNALINAQRDLISGISSDLILANFVRECVE